MSSISAGTTSTTTLIHSGDTTGSLVFKTNDTGSGGTTAVTIDTSQRVGIGTTSPTSPLQVNTAGVNTTVQINSTDANGGYGANIALNNTGTGGRQYALFSTSNADGEVGGGKFKFYDVTASTTRMLIDSSGNFLVGRTSQTPNTNSGFCVAPSGRTEISRSNGADCIAIYCTNNGNQVGGIVSNTASTSYNTTSDYRLKENIVPMTGALAKVAQLKPVNYTWKETGEQTQGFIAHELQEVVPECVVGEKDAVDANGNPIYQGIDTSFLVATLTAAIQEQQALITAQAETINALTARVVALESK